MLNPPLFSKNTQLKKPYPSTTNAQASPLHLPNM